MAEPPFTPPKPKREAGCSFVISMIVVSVFVTVTTVRICFSPVNEAKREMKTNPCRAASLFATQVRADQRPGSYDALQQLRQIPDPCALRELIGLLDIPDGRWIGHQQRDQIFKTIRSRIGNKPNLPEYDPQASALIRAKQKQQWLDWLEQNK